jgi:hypothetical protein
VANSQYEEVPSHSVVLYTAACMVASCRCVSSSSSPSTCWSPVRGFCARAAYEPSRPNALAQASVDHQQSVRPSCAESHPGRSRRARTDHAVDSPGPTVETRRARQAGDAAQIPQGAGGSQVPAALFLVVESSPPATDPAPVARARPGFPSSVTPRTISGASISSALSRFCCAAIG